MVTESIAPLLTLDQISPSGTGERPILGTYASNMGNRTISARFAVADMNRISVVANGLDSPAGEEIAQRPLDLAHATKLAEFILKGLVQATLMRATSQDSVLTPVLSRLHGKLGEQPYCSMPPLIANLRDAGMNGKNLRAESLKDGDKGEVIAVRFWLRSDQLLYIIDGQHRRKAIEMVMEFLEGDVLQRRRYGKHNLYGNDGLEIPMDEFNAWNDVYQTARRDAMLVVEIHLGLSVSQERQLFHDTNNLGKRVAPSLALSFDSGNPINAFIKNDLEAKGVLAISDHDNTLSDWSDDQGSLNRKDVVAVNAFLFLHRTNIKSARQIDIDTKKALANKFWRAVAAIPRFGEKGARASTVAAQAVVLKALAKLMHEFSFRSPVNEVLRDRLLTGIGTIDFSHDNPMWNYYNLTESERQDTKTWPLRVFLPQDVSTLKRDIGRKDAAGRMRFSSKHNDIVPVLADMIRWTLGLPNRHAV